MFNTILGAGAVGAGAASRYGSGSYQMMRLLAAPAPQNCFSVKEWCIFRIHFKVRSLRKIVLKKKICKIFFFSKIPDMTMCLFA
jgi:hypothetical protein